jgi:nitrate/nitrite transport system permease protein
VGASPGKFSPVYNGWPVGFTLAAIVGIALGILIGSSALIYDAAFIPFFKSCAPVPPPSSVYRLCKAAFRNNEPSAIFVIFITAISPIIINTAVGVQQVPQDYKNV